MNYRIGIDIGGTKTAYGLFDEGGNLLEKVTEASDDAILPEVFFGHVADVIAETVKKHGGIDQLLSVGIGIPGYVDTKTGQLSTVASLPKLSGFPAGEYLKKQLREVHGMPQIQPVLDNDGHCGALAEYRLGSGKGHRHMIYALVSTGISTAIVIDGSVFRGSNGGAGESGHMLACVPEKLRHTCMCGNEGCFNSLASGKAIVSYVREWIAAGERTIMSELAGSPEEITARHISEAYDLGDAMAVRAVDQMVQYLSVWLYNVYVLLNIDCIVLSGGLLNMGDKLIGQIRERFASFHTNGFPVELLTSSLDGDSCLFGAMELGKDGQKPTK